MISEELKDCQEEIYRKAKDDSCSYEEWVKEFLNPFIVLAVLEDHQTRIGALIKDLGLLDECLSAREEISK